MKAATILTSLILDTSVFAEIKIVCAVCVGSDASL